MTVTIEISSMIPKARVDLQLVVAVEIRPKVIRNTHISELQLRLGDLTLDPPLS